MNTKPLDFLKQQLQQLARLNNEDWELFQAQLRPIQLKKQALLLREGAICRDAFFIAKGCLRYFYIVNGEERTGQFFFERAWYTDFYSFTTGQATEENIQALEDCELYALDRVHYLKLLDQIPRLERWGRVMAEQAFIGVKKRNDSFLKETPEERYLDLVKNRPKVIQRVPQYYIASYLGIQAPSLSRIRKRLREK